MKYLTVLVIFFAVILAGCNGDESKNGDDNTADSLIVFHPNGGTGQTPVAMFAKPGATITLPEGNGLIKNDWAFGSWNTKADGTGTEYQSGASYQVTSNITFYATYIEPLCEISFDANGGTGTVPDPMFVKSGASINLPAGTGLVKGDWTFGGWNTNAFELGTSYNAGASYTVNADAVLYAFYLPPPGIESLDISFNSGDNTWRISGADFDKIKNLPNGRAHVKIYFYVDNAFDRWDAGWVNNNNDTFKFGDNHQHREIKMLKPVIPSTPYWAVTVPVAMAKAGQNNLGQQFAIWFNTAMRVTGVKADLIIGDGGTDTGFSGDQTLYTVSGGYSKPVPADPDFHIYLAIGQSNMSGDFWGGQVIPPDFAEWTDERFKILNTLGPPMLNGTKGEWRVARPPTFMNNMGLNPCDNFGRTLVAETPSDIKIGTINLAVSGAQLLVYHKTHYAGFVNGLATSNPGMWQLAYPHAMGYPYKAMVEWGREAQKLGVIKGIIMQHGEAGSGGQDYATVLTQIYNNLLEDLNLEPGSIPFIAGTPRTGHESGMGSTIITVIRNLANQHNWFHVIDFDDFQTNSDWIDPERDYAHFAPDGQIEAGRRFAMKMLELNYE